MAKYVIFHFNNKPSTFAEVADFGLDTIKDLSDYNEQWTSMQFVDGTRTRNEAENNDVFSGNLVKSVYYGKRLSYKIVKQIVGNDLKYKDLLWRMNTHCRNAFEIENVNIQSDEEYKDKLRSYSEKFDNEHFLLFVPPNNFRGGVFDSPVSVSIEEFANVVLKYDEALMALRLNSAVGEEYLKKNQFVLEFFRNYFDMMNRTIGTLAADKQIEFFGSCCFHFEDFVAFSSLEDINFFLDVCDYTYGFSTYEKEVFRNYRKYVNNFYEEYNFKDEMSL